MSYPLTTSQLLIILLGVYLGVAALSVFYWQRRIRKSLRASDSTDWLVESLNLLLILLWPVVWLALFLGRLVRFLSRSAVRAVQGEQNPWWLDESDTNLDRIQAQIYAKPKKTPDQLAAELEEAARWGPRFSKHSVLELASNGDTRAVPFLIQMLGEMKYNTVREDTAETSVAKRELLKYGTRILPQLEQGKKEATKNLQYLSIIDETTPIDRSTLNYEGRMMLQQLLRNIAEVESEIRRRRSAGTTHDE